MLTAGAHAAQAWEFVLLLVGSTSGLQGALLDTMLESKLST